MDGFHKWGSPNMDGVYWKIMENPSVTLMIWGFPLFIERLPERWSKQTMDLMI